MNKSYELEGCKIRVELNEGIIRVYSNAELWRFLNGQADRRFSLLVKTIKRDYQETYQQPLAISNDSLMVEILVHVYCDYLGLKFNRLIKFRAVNNIVNKLLVRAEIVDCGEKEKDSNRWIWDFLARFKSSLIRLLPQNLNKTNLKIT